MILKLLLMGINILLNDSHKKARHMKHANTVRKARMRCPWENKF